MNSATPHVQVLMYFAKRRKLTTVPYDHPLLEARSYLQSGSVLGLGLGSGSGIALAMTPALALTRNGLFRDKCVAANTVVILPGILTVILTLTLILILILRLSLSRSLTQILARTLISNPKPKPKPKIKLIFSRFIAPE